MFKKYKVEIIIFTLALILRLAVAYIVYDHNDFNYGQFLGDIRADGYYTTAYNLVNHGIFSLSPIDSQAVTPGSIRTPGYPAMIAVVLYIFNSIWPLLILQIIVGSLLPLLGKKISFEITQNNFVSNFVALFLAIEPVGIWLSVKLLAEIFFTLFFFLFILFIFKFIKIDQYKNILINNNFKVVVLAGFFLGIATLIKPTTLYFPIILAVSWCIYRYFLKQKLLLKHVIIFLLTFIFIISPWLYRNYVTFGTASLSSISQEVLFWALAPSVLAIKNNQNFAQAQADFFQSQGLVSCPLINLDQAHLFQARAIKVLKHNPKELTQLAGISLLTFFTHDGALSLLSFVGAIESIGLTVGQILAQPLPELLHTVKGLVASPAFFIILARLFWILIAFLFFSSIIYMLAKKRLTVITVFALICVAYFALTTVSNGLGVNARFRFPVNVFIFTFAISFLYKIVDVWKQRIYKKKIEQH